MVATIILLTQVCLLQGHAPDAALAAQPTVLSLDSGVVRNTSEGLEIVYSTTVRVPGAPWLQLYFEDVQLSGSVREGTQSYIMLTSVADGGVQTLNATHMTQWQNTSAYFNGDAVRVELVAYPHTGENRLVVKKALAGIDTGTPRTICGDTDDRVLSNDPRMGRVYPGNCTAWLIDDPGHCMLTAGHCSSVFALRIIEFNVPLSNADGSTNFAAPEDQYTVDQTSVQSMNSGIGNDWGYFGCFPNPTTGLTPFEAQGSFFALAAAPPPATGQTLRISGYGFVDPPVSPTWHQVQKTHTGSYVSFVGTTLQYEIDTTTGNSGSPVVDETTGEAIGIHTHGGCTATGDANHGTAIDHAGLLSALANPQGVCDVPCSAVGDIDGDCDVDAQDSDLFVGVLVGTNPNPDHISASDLNGDGSADGDDVQLFVGAFIGA